MMNSIVRKNRKFSHSIRNLTNPLIIDILIEIHIANSKERVKCFQLECREPVGGVNRTKREIRVALELYF